jgi:hypothetical protein
MGKQHRRMRELAEDAKKIKEGKKEIIFLVTFDRLL